MRRFPTLLIVLSCALGCAGHQPLPAVSTSDPVASREAASRKMTPPADSAAATALPQVVPPPVRDSITLDLEELAERRFAIDSAKDEVVLDELAEAHATDDDAVDTDPGADPVKALTNAVSWDIDVETFNNHNRVQYYLSFFGTKGRERMGIWLNRMPRYEAMIRARLRKEGLPSDLVYLALIESGFSNTATSRAKAVGMWQFMKGTAKLYGLRVDSWVDERRDPFRATDAAVRHLRDLTQRFGSVYLAAAAYNAGAGRVSRGLVRLPSDDESDSLNSDATFFRLYDTRLLRRETKDYVPKLIAAALIAKQPARHGFEVEASLPAVYDSLVVPDMTGLDVIARLADTTVAAIRELNPQYLRLATPPGARSVIRLPVGRGPATQLAYAAVPPDRRVTFIEHTVRRGETLSGIAQRYGVSAGYVAEANPKLNARRLRTGQLVVIPTGGARSTVIARRMAEPVAPAGTSTSGWHRVRRGETLSEIADEYGVKVRELRAWNTLGSRSQIRAGQRLRVAPVTVARAAKSKPKIRDANPQTHVVRRGETLTGLARRYGITIQALRDANGMSSEETLKVGATLRIPG